MFPVISGSCVRESHQHLVLYDRVHLCVGKCVGALFFSSSSLLFIVFCEKTVYVYLLDVAFSFQPSQR